MNDVEEIQKGFYDNWTYKFLEDYLTQNKRIESAILFAKEWIKTDSSTILDVGCGIGWSTFEFAKTFLKSHVVGIDLSKNSIRAATHLFNTVNIKFKNASFFDLDGEMRFDSIVLLDVYEHIPKDERSKFNNLLSKILVENGRIVLSLPSKFHQNWLRKNNPVGLQPIDETIEIEDMVSLAKQISGEIIYCKYINIANTNDYLHVVIEKNVQYNSIGYFRLNSKNLESIISRFRRVKKSDFNKWFRENKQRLKYRRSIKALIYDKTPKQVKKIWRIIK
jgi:cyclopropane fatty-acyl-phospholipid synthase-like methyltransferase